jgi:hypothetical protein
MDIRIADSSTDCHAKLIGEEQKSGRFQVPSATSVFR